MRTVVGAARRHVDRHVAEQPHPALVGIAAQRAPLALEADLVIDGIRPGEALPVLDPVAVALAEICSLGGVTGARGDSSNPGQAAKAERALYGER